MNKLPVIPPKKDGPRKIRYVGFDLDGTLIDTISQHEGYFGQFMESRFGIDPQEAAKHYAATAGIPTSEQIDSLLKKQNLNISSEEIAQLTRVIDAGLEKVEAKPFAEIPKLFTDLKNGGYHLFICSSQQTSAVGRILQKSKLLPFIEFFIGIDLQRKNLKKGKAQFREVANHFQIPYKIFIKESVFIGDGISDMRAAVETGVIGIGRKGTRTQTELLSAKAEIVLDNLTKLPETIKKLKSQPS